MSNQHRLYEAEEGFDDSYAGEYVDKKEKRRRRWIILLVVVIFFFLLILYLTRAQNSEVFTKTMIAYDVLYDEDLEIQIDLFTVHRDIGNDEIKGSVQFMYEDSELDFTLDFNDASAHSALQAHLNEDFPSNYNPAFRTELENDVQEIEIDGQLQVLQIVNSFYWDPDFSMVVVYGEGFTDDGDVLIVAADELTVSDEILDYFSEYLNDDREERRYYTDLQN